MKLNPCPHCGGEMKMDYKLRPLRYAVKHVSKFYWTDRCYGGTDYIYSSEKEAAEAWNAKENS